MALLGCCCECECEDEQDEHSRQRGTQQRREPRRAAQADTPSMPPVKRAPLLDEPLIVSPPSYDSPQRPSRWGHPRTEENGMFLGGTREGQLWPPPTFYDDQADPHHLNFEFAVDHDERWIMRRMDTFSVQSGLSPGAVQFPWRDKIKEQPPELVFPPVTDGNINSGAVVAWYSPAPGDLTERSGGTTTRAVTERVLHFDGHEESRVVGYTTTTNTIYKGKVTVWYRLPGEQDYTPHVPTAYRTRTEWKSNGHPPGSHAHLTTRVVDTQGYIAWTVNGNRWEKWVTLNTQLSFFNDYDRAVENGLTEYGITEQSVTGLEDEQQREPTSPEPPPERFVAGDVIVSGPRNQNPAYLNDGEDHPQATLSAWGHTLTGGSWAALRAHPTRKADGTLDMGGVIVLHEQGGTVTAIRPEGAETCTREVFEREILRCDTGTFRGFTDAGTLFTEWPHPWAFADCGTQARALVAHEPWRDSTKIRDPGLPEHWAWPGRPGRRPRTPPTAAPRPPLGLTLADVVAEAHDSEPLPRREPPLLLPERVDVWQGRWLESEAALRALRKRLLYQPAGWDEELDDRSSVRGRLRLHYPYEVIDAPGTRTTGTLLVRVRRPRTADPWARLRRNGVFSPLEATFLGHNVTEVRGWHPCTLALGRLSSGTVTIELETTAPLSRALLHVQEEIESGDA